MLFQHFTFHKLHKSCFSNIYNSYYIIRIRSYNIWYYYIQNYYTKFEFNDNDNKFNYFIFGKRNKK